MGQKITIAAPILGQILKLDESGAISHVQTNLREEVLFRETFNYLASTAKGTTNAIMLPFFYYILHLIVAWTIKPIGIKYSLVKSQEMSLMHHTKRNTKINLSKFIFFNMMKVITGARKQLIYVMVINQIIDFHGQNTNVTLLPFTQYTLPSIVI